MISGKIMKQIISKIGKTTIPSKVVQKSKKEIADKKAAEEAATTTTSN